MTLRDLSESRPNRPEFALAGAREVDAFLAEPIIVTLLSPLFSPFGCLSAGYLSPHVDRACSRES